MRASSGADAVRWLLEVSHTLPPADLGDAVAQAMASLGATASCVFLIDHDQRRMHPFGPGADDHDPVDLDTTIAGRAFTAERTQTATTAAAVRLWVPLIDGTARLGVVAVDLPRTATTATPCAVQELASLVALLVITKGHYTDAMEQVRRHRPMTLAAGTTREQAPARWRW